MPLRDIIGCARCHGDGHKGLEFRELTHPMDLTDISPRAGVATEWATCTNGEPILFFVIEDGREV